MSRRIESKGVSLVEALSAAVAELVDCDPEKVEIAAPGIEAVSGQIRLELDVASEPEPAAPAPARERAQPRADEDPTSDEITAEDLDEEADAAADFLEGLLDAMDLPGDMRIRVREEHAEVEIVEVGSGALIGRRGQTLEAIQELVRCAMQRRFERRSRVQIDVEGYRARRIEKLIEKAEDAIDAVLDSGEAERLEPMDVFERKVIHQLVAEVDGLASRSQGREPGRRVVIEPV